LNGKQHATDRQGVEKLFVVSNPAAVVSAEPSRRVGKACPSGLPSGGQAGISIAFTASNRRF
jgi:hypothetical protein